MPVLGGSAYGTVADILRKARAILNDAEVPGGDAFTDSCARALPLVSLAYSHIQGKLSTVGVEVLSDYFWLVGIPTVATVDPEARIIVTDSACNLIYPNGVGDAAFVAPILPPDMIVPLKLWERQNGTANPAVPMKQPNDGLLNLPQALYLVDWEWGAYQSNDCIMFRGALQIQDVKIKYAKQFWSLAAVTDPVPIRGVDNAAAYEVAMMVAGTDAPAVEAIFGKKAEEEIFLLQSIAVRKTQRQRVRRIPYSGRSHRRGPVF